MQIILTAVSRYFRSGPVRTSKEHIYTLLISHRVKQIYRGGPYGMLHSHGANGIPLTLEQGGSGMSLEDFLLLYGSLKPGPSHSRPTRPLGVLSKWTTAMYMYVQL